MLARWLGAPRARGDRRPRTPDSARGDPFEALLDDARMRVFRVDYPEIIDQLIELFVESTPPLLGELRAGAETGDDEAVRRAAHKLKGSCQNIGAGFMAKLAGGHRARERGRPGRARRARPDLRRHARRPALGAAGERRVMDAVLLALAAVAILTAVLARRAARPRAASPSVATATLAAQWPETAIGLIDRDLRFTLFEGDALTPHWTPAEVLGRRLADIIPADRIEEVRPSVEAALAGETSTLEWVGRALEHDLPHRRRPLPRERRRDHARDARDPRHRRGEGAAALARGAARLPLRRPHATRRARDRVRRRRPASSTSAPATPPGKTDLHPLEWAEAFGLMHPDGQRVRPARGAAAARAARRRGARRRDARRDARRHARAAGQRRPGA